MHSESYRKLFYEILPETMERLCHEQTPEVIADAATVYFAEGVLAGTGYKSFYDGLKTIGKIPGVIEGIIGDGEKGKEYHSDIKKFSEKQLMVRIESRARAKGQTIEGIYRSAGGSSKL